MLTKGTSDPVSAVFSDVPSGAIGIRASAPPDTLRITNSGASVTVLPKVSLTLAASGGGATATATAEITDGTLTSPVDITAHIMGPGRATDEKTISGLSSSSSGGMETAIFTGLAPGDWTLDSSKISAPAGVILNIDSTSTATILPLVTVTAALAPDDMDNVIVTATVSEGPIGAVDVPLKIELLDSSSMPIADQEKTLTFARGSSASQTAEFADVPSGAIGIRASAPPDTLRITNSGASVTVLPKVSLTLASSGGETATATARITDGTLNSPVDITAHIMGPGGATAMGEIRALSSGSIGKMETATITRLQSGSWALDSSKISAPAGVILDISGTSATVAALPVVTISSAVDRDVVTVTATVSEGPIGGMAVPLTIVLRDSSLDPVRPAETIELAANSATGSTMTADFRDIGSGDYTIGASAPADRVRISNAGANVTVPPKVSLTLTSTSAGTATATARIIDGTISSTNAVDITAHIAGPDGATAMGEIRGLSSSSSGRMETATFSGLEPGDWTLDSGKITAPARIILNVVTTPVNVAKPPAATTITPTLTDDTLVVQVAVTDGSQLTSRVRVQLTLTGGRRATDVRMQIVDLDPSITNPSGSKTFDDLPSGRYTLTAAAGPSVDITPITPSILTVSPKVLLTLASDTAEKATVTATITDGTLTSAVNIPVRVNGPGSTFRQTTLRLSSSSGPQAVTFTVPRAGRWL